jgi:hypothetical protein
LDRFRRSLGKSFNCFQTIGLFTPGFTTRFFGPLFEGRISDPELQIKDYEYSRVDDLSDNHFATGVVIKVHRKMTHRLHLTEVIKWSVDRL